MTAHGASTIHRVGVLGFNILAYILGCSSLILLILVYGSFLTPENAPIFQGPQFSSTVLSVLWNLLWIAGFGYKHTAMASQAFKQTLAKAIPPAMNRGVYMLATAAYLYAMLYFWSPVDITLWSTEGASYFVVLAFFVFGWGFLFLATFMIDHFELFGLKQGYYYFTRNELPELSFVKTGFYAYVRHPIMTGLLIGIWCVPRMDVGLFVMSAGFSAYVFIGVHFEEKKLKRLLGVQYEDYCRSVGSVIPKLV